MSNPSPTEQSPSASHQSIAGMFTRLGWIGFWLQVALATLPIVMLVYVLLLSGSNSLPGRSLALRDYVAFGSLLVLFFTMFWSYRYTRLAKRMLIPERRPSSASVIRSLWAGIVAGCLGAYISVLLLLVLAGRLLFVFMTAPQGGMPVIQTATDNRVGWVSAIDMMDLMTMGLALTAELSVMASSLWLLHRMLRCAPSYDQNGDAGSSPIESPAPR